MASLSTAKHIIGEIDGTRCTIIESNVTKSRMEFLRQLLEYNKLEVIVREEAKADQAAESLYTVGVTDIIFNPVYAIYERTLLRPDGTVVTPAWYRQLGGDTEVPYYNYGKTEVADQYE
ncbi:MAG: hypothetical protein QUS66_15320 [Bacteroidota bacterium]|nr:hypothetical protein [Bacteroidota bacterium]